MTRRPSGEFARLGDENYERDIRHRVEAEHHGAAFAIDMESGTWPVGDTVIVARVRLRTKRPEAIDVWLVRVGNRALPHFGGCPLAERGVIAGLVKMCHEAVLTLAPQGSTR